MDLSALTVQQLRYLVAVDRLRSFRDAASACHVSQPALSMQVKRLEEILGVPIFDRSRQPVVSQTPREPRKLLAGPPPGEKIGGPLENRRLRAA
jgi:hypothetical protein